MNQTNAPPTLPNATQEADIGSGERSPGQCETDALIDQIGRAPPPDSPSGPAKQDEHGGTQQKAEPK